MDLVSAGTSTLISLIIVIVTSLILLWQLVLSATNLTRQKARIAIFLQFLFCFLRNVTIIIQLGVPGVNCGILVSAGFVIYSIWIAVLEYLLLIRSQAFASHPKALSVVVYLLLAAFIALHWCLTSTIQITSLAGELCSYDAQFSLSNYTLAIRTVLEVAILVPFVTKALQSYKVLKNAFGQENSKMWLDMSIINGVVTAGIISVELIAAVVSQIPQLAPFLDAIYSIVNTSEACLVVFLIEDLRKNLTSAASTRSRSGKTTTTV